MICGAIWKTSEILNIIAPIIECSAFFVLERASNIRSGGIGTGLTNRNEELVNLGRTCYEKKSYKKSAILYRRSYYLVFLGFGLWIASGILAHCEL